MPVAEARSKLRHLHTLGEDRRLFPQVAKGVLGEGLERLAHPRALLGELVRELSGLALAADAHFRVEKVPGDPTHTQIERLSDDERREELERMLGGAVFLSTGRRS